MTLAAGQDTDWAAVWLAGSGPPGLPAIQPNCVAVARAEGVVSLLYARLAAAPSNQVGPGQSLQSLGEAARRETAHSLRVRAECLRISAALESAGIPVLWLKGVALAQWLYPSSHLRDLADADLLFASRADALRAAEVLAPLGFTLPNPHLAGDLVVNQLMAKSRSGLELDLHWALGNSPLYARRLHWAEMLAEARPLPTLGSGAMGLSPVHALLHACMHLMVNRLVGQGNRLRWLYDIHLLANRLSAQEWSRVEVLAAERGLAGTCHQALLATRARLDTSPPPSLMDALAGRAKNEPLRCERLGAWHYRQWAEWQSLPSLGQRWRWLRQLLFPDLAHLRGRYATDRAGTFTVFVRRFLDGVRRWRSYRAGAP